MHSIRAGALLAVAVGGVGALVMAVSGVTSGDGRLMSGAGVLTALLAVSGALGGLAFDATAKLRVSGWLGVAARWFISIVAALVLLAVSARWLPDFLHLTGNAGWRAAELRGQSVVVALLGASALLAILAANSTPAPRSHSSFGPVPSPVLVWGVVILVFLSMNSFLGESAHIPLADDSATAARVVRYAWEEARANPRSERAQLAAGYASMNLDRFEESLPAFQAAVRLDAGNANTQRSLGWTYNQLERFDEAIPHLREATRLQPGFAEAYEDLAWAYGRLERWEESERGYRRSLRYDANNAKALRELAWVLANRSRDSLALFEALRSLALDSSDAWTHAFVGKLFRNQARFDDALAHLETAMRIDARYPLVWVYLGATRYSMGDPAAAKKAFDEALRLDSAVLMPRPIELAMYLAAGKGLSGAEALRPFLPASVTIRTSRP